MCLKENYISILKSFFNESNIRNVKIRIGEVMAGYSKESKRQNDALKSILDGGAPEKRVQVGYEGKKQVSGDQISPLSDVMKT